MKSIPNSKGGFTLTELMISFTILGILMTMALTFYFESTESMFVSDQKNRINRDIRALTSEMLENARQANTFLLYKSFSIEDRDTAGDRLYDGETGDFLLLVYYDDDFENGNSLQRPPITKLVGYFRNPDDPADPASRGPVTKFELDFNEGSDLDIEDLIPASMNNLQSRQVIELSRGLANGRLFYNFWQKSIMVNGQIYHGNRAKWVTDTYNFTISPRG